MKRASDLPVSSVLISKTFTALLMSRGCFGQGHNDRQISCALGNRDPTLGKKVESVKRVLWVRTERWLANLLCPMEHGSNSGKKVESVLKTKQYYPVEDAKVLSPKGKGLKAGGKTIL